MNRQLLDQTIDKLLAPGKPSTAPPREVSRAAQEWSATKRRIRDLSTTLQQLGSRSDQLKEELAPIIKAVEDQCLRVDRIVVALTKRKDIEEVVKPLSSILESMRTRAQQFLVNATSEVGYQKSERCLFIRLLEDVQTLAKKSLKWLRGTDKQIAELERLVHFGE